MASFFCSCSFQCTSFAKFNNFHFRDRRVYDFETHQRFDKMKTMVSGCTGINKKHIVHLWVSFDREDVTVATDEDVRSMGLENFLYPRVVIRRCSADMSYPDVKALTLEPQIFRQR